MGLIEGSRIEERLTKMVRADLCQLLMNHAILRGLDEEKARKEFQEIEEGVMEQIYTENRSSFGGWA